MPKIRCTGCKDRFEKPLALDLPAGKFHSYECASEWANNKTKKRNKAIAVKAKKAERKQHAADKERVKPRSKWLEELQALVNQYVRLRDKKEGCISCDKPASWHGQFHASHYFPRGRCASVRFNLLNIWKACSVCNLHLSGNLVEYKPRLIEKIGQQKFDELVLLSTQTKSYDIEWIKRAKKITRKGIKRLEGRL